MQMENCWNSDDRHCINVGWKNWKNWENIYHQKGDITFLLGFISVKCGIWWFETVYMQNLQSDSILSVRKKLDGAG